MKRPIAILALLVAGCTSAGGPSESGVPASGDAPSAALAFTPETDASASGTVTLEAGGTVSASAADGTTFELVVPPEAVAGDTEITLTPLSDVTGIEADALHAVQLEPEGLAFHELVRLTITPAEPIAVADQLMFQAAGDGSEPGLALIDPRSEPIVLLLEHFSIGGVGSVTPQQRAVFAEKSAGNAERRIANDVRSLLGAERQRQLLGASDEMSAEATAEMERLTTEFQREVLDKRREAAMSSCKALTTYVTSVIGFERGRQLLGMTAAEEAASSARINEALAAMEARYDECEKEAIAACQKAKDPRILIDFWLALERPADQARAEMLCDPKGLQFAFSGEQTAPWLGDMETVQYEYWGLLCEGSEEWRIWERLENYAGGFDTGPPGAGAATPILAKFGGDGTVAGMTLPYFGQSPDGTTLGGTILVLKPGDEPTSVTARIPAGDERIEVSAPVEPADGTIAPCETVVTP